MAEDFCREKFPSRPGTAVDRQEVEALSGTESPNGCLVRYTQYPMNNLLIIIILLLLLGGGGFYFGGPVYGGSGLGLVLLVCIIIALMGGFRTRE